MTNFEQFKRGLKNGSPIGVAYLTSGTALGLMMHSAGFKVWEGFLMSAIVLAGAGEFAALSLWLVGAANFEIILTNAILNFRYFLQCSTVSRRLEPNVHPLFRMFLGFSTADESFSMATIGEKGDINRFYMLGLNMISYPFWVLGSAIGCYGASWISANLQASMSISLYGMFIGLLIPAMKKSRPVCFVIALSAAINLFIRLLPFTKNWNMGWSILISTIVSSVVTSVLYPYEEGKE